MDIATLIGILVGSGLLFLSVADQLALYVNVPSVFVVIGGSLAAVCISVPFARLLKAFSVIKHALFAKTADPRDVIKEMVRFGEIARKDGILALEDVIGEVEDDFLVRGIQMAVDGSDPEAIQEAMTTELEYVQQRHKECRSLVQGLGNYAPAFGMIGTLIGLIGMLAQLDDPDAIGPNMAVALITTLYGAVLANLFALPLSEKLEARNEEEVLIKELIIQGVMAIQSGDNPRIVEQKLKVFLPPDKRG